MIDIRCVIGFHIGSWETKCEEVPFFNEDSNEYEMWKIETKHRFCKRCGKEQHQKNFKGLADSLEDSYGDFAELKTKEYCNYLQDLFGALEHIKPLLRRTNSTLSEDEIEEIKRLGSKHEFSSEDGEITCYIYDDKIYVTDMRIKYENNHYKQKP